MQNFMLTLVTVGIIGLSGCFSLESEISKTTGQEHVVERNYGWRLFNWIPLCCGNVNDHGGLAKCAFFRDDVTIDKMQERFFKHVAEKGRTAYDVNYHNYDTVLFELPLFGFTIPVPYILTYKEIQISGVLK